MGIRGRIGVPLSTEPDGPAGANLQKEDRTRRQRDGENEGIRIQTPNDGLLIVCQFNKNNDRACTSGVL